MTLGERFSNKDHYLTDRVKGKYIDDLKEKISDKNERLLYLEFFEGNDLRELRRLIQSTILGTPYNDQLDCMRAINYFFDQPDEGSETDDKLWDTGSGGWRICQVDKLFTKTDTEIRLLRELQGGENIRKEDGINREDLADLFGMSPTAMNTYLSKLKKGTDILGSKVKIEPQHSTNKYDSTVHPVFLALNLTEVYMLTVLLKKELGSQAKPVVDDIYRQLSDYARGIIDKAAKRDKVDLLEGRTVGELKGGYRKEKKTEPGYFLKTGKECEIGFKDELPLRRTGRLSWNDNGYVFIDKNSGEEYPFSIDLYEVEYLGPAQKGN